MARTTRRRNGEPPRKESRRSWRHFCFALWCATCARPFGHARGAAAARLHHARASNFPATTTCHHPLPTTLTWQVELQHVSADSAAVLMTAAAQAQLALSGTDSCVLIWRHPGDRPSVLRPSDPQFMAHVSPRVRQDVLPRADATVQLCSVLYGCRDAAAVLERATADRQLAAFWRVPTDGVLPNRVRAAVPPSHSPTVPPCCCAAVPPSRRPTVPPSHRPAVLPSRRPAVLPPRRPAAKPPPRRVLGG